MRVVQKKDNAVRGMLQDELKRCKEMSESLREAIASLPKGSIHQRRVQYKKQVKIYHYLKYRNAGKSVYQHVPRAKVEQLELKISERRRKEEKLKAFEDRIKYLNKLLKA
jgi:hypothetical protein